ncbi:hypothetical protein [Chondromyces crocatus]|uniref:HEAT repeat domain-containing protein n=1 Tax=Chondromyces crocatus TaxID=52 RepID=A0A0K1EKH5_CHOCO|nr:hypothetical protein [Chondromyces crocatus]AKT41078.1 uncharacterized protein CMC5_052370 [Chondromyces crocatus]
MSRFDLSVLRGELLQTHHRGRIERMLELGRLARNDREALLVIDTFARGDVYERRLALYAQHTLRDGERLLAFMADASRSLRSLAFELVPLVCDDTQALEALKMAFSLRRERKILVALAGSGRRHVVDGYLDWLAEQPGLQDFADLVSLGSPEGIRRHLERAQARPSRTFWSRLAQHAPDTLGRLLIERLRAVPGEPDPVTRQRIEAHAPRLARRAPDVALVLFELLFSRGIFSRVADLVALAALRPEATLALIERYEGLQVPGAPFARGAAAFGVDVLGRLVRREPGLLGSAEKLVKVLSEEQLAAVVEAWSDVAERHPAWGTPLLKRFQDPARRLAVWERWSIATRGSDGVIPVDVVAELPVELQEREARRHLGEVVALETRPGERIRHVRFLPWEEASVALRAYLGHPEGAMRGAALSALLAIPGYRPEEETLAGKALGMVLARKNEQDPVRHTMLLALCTWPRAVWRPEHTAGIGQILRDALDAGDLSHGTAQAAETLLRRTFRLDPAWGAGWLGTLLKERGTLHDARIGLHLSDDEVRAAATVLLGVAKAWSSRERVPQLLALGESLGERLPLVTGLPDLLAKAARITAWGSIALSVYLLFRRFDRARYEADLAEVLGRWLDKGWVAEVLTLAASVDKPGRRQPPLPAALEGALERICRGEGRNEHAVQALSILSARAPAVFQRLVPELLEKDESIICIPAVCRYLHLRRQDLLGPFLEIRTMRGRFATGETAWVIPFERGFHRWTPPQNVSFSRSVTAVMSDADRDIPTVWRFLTLLSALDSAPMDALAALADDARPAVQERAIRVMARCDQGQCLPTLLRCLEDGRARIAIYGLRRALKDVLPRETLRLLCGVPMAKVTVAKEVVRLIGTLRLEAAYEHLVHLDGTTLHRDVRIALLRALWDHLDREPTWGVFERAVTGIDWLMASRLGDIPADRLTRQADQRLSALLARVLARPEPEARIDLLLRAWSLSVSDPERTFLAAVAARLVSVYDDEVRAAVTAILQRCAEDDVARLPGLLRVALSDARCLHVAVSALVSVNVKGRAVWIALARAAEAVLADDPRWSALRVRCAAAAMAGQEFAEWLAALGEQGGLSADALEACRSAIDALPAMELAPLLDRLRRSVSPEARRVAVWALVRDAGPERGWTPERLEQLAALQTDPSPFVAGAALSVFPPREMVLAHANERRRRDPAASPPG